MMSSNNGTKALSAIILLLFLTGCATGYAPVSDISNTSAYQATKKKVAKRRVETVPNQYKVKPGDTLYSIAWRYGLDYRKLAQVNGISKDYLIYQGQLLKTKFSSSIKTVKKQDKPKLNAIKKTVEKRDVVVNKKIKTSNNTSKKSTVNKNNKTAVSKNSSSMKIIWRWPYRGRVISKFTRDNKGLDISGIMGDPVVAAASGKVVYAGNGIIGYGKLIIINHNQEYLSAYAHNSVILVTENDSVKAGEKIAEIGSSGTTKTILHFEIRKDGKPVNPIKYLPKK